ncbi:MAG: PDZ domain-containing protein [Chloroflexi bacterium]|nr:MAG: PDZ domain-containing protein [Chloroflexota bacterium]
MDLLTPLAFILILSLLIFVHELGHFIVAKRSGIIVEEFAIGFPPRAVKLWQEEGKITLDGVEYVIGRKVNLPRNIVPGAKVYAELSTDEKGRPCVVRLELAELPDDKKPRRNSETRFFGLFSRRAPAVPVPREKMYRVDALERPTEYAINWIPIGGYVRMLGEEDPTAPGSFASKSKKVRFAVLVAGSAMNLVAAVVFFTLTAMSGVPEPVTGINLAGEEAPLAQTVITDVVEDTPADRAGLEPGDIIVGADEVEFKYAGDLVYYVGNHKGEEITLHLDRNGQRISTRLTPRVNPPENQGAMGVAISYEGIQNKITYYPLPQAMVKGVAQTGNFVTLTFYLPIAIMQNVFPAEAARPTGPVGIYQQTGSAVQAAVEMSWWFPVFWLTAVLSTALAVTNMLPIPALDGGRILFIIIEAIRGERVPPEKEGAIHFIGLAVLLTLMLVISYYDVNSPIPTIDWGNLF